MMAKPTEVQAVVFDMDGVLIDSHPAHRAAWRQFLNTMGKNVSEAELDYILDGHRRSDILCHFFGDLDETGLQEYGRLKDDIFRGLEHEIKPVRGVLDFIAELSRRGIVMAIATSASEIRTFSTVERMGLGGCFEAVITASDVSEGKPDPAVYRLACERTGIQPRLALAFDDASSGVMAATSAGMRCIGVASNGTSVSLLRAGAEEVIQHFEGFILNSPTAQPSTENHIHLRPSVSVGDPPDNKSANPDIQ